MAKLMPPGTIDFDKQCVTHNEPVSITITTNDLSAIEIHGSSNVITLTEFTGDDLYLDIKGSGDMDLDIEYNSLAANIDGSGKIEMFGSADVMNVAIDGSGDIRAFEFPVKNSTIDISGSGDARVDVSDFLRVDIDGSGDVIYQGTPGTEVNISGSGDVRRDS